MDAQRGGDAIQGVERDLGSRVGTEPIDGREMKAGPAGQFGLAHPGLLQQFPELKTRGHRPNMDVAQVLDQSITQVL